MEGESTKKDGATPRAAWEPMRVDYLGHVTELVMGGTGEGQSQGKLSIEGSTDPANPQVLKKPPGIG